MRMDTAELAWESMRSGIEGQVALLASAPRQLYEHARGLLDGPAPTKIYFVGCGDSYFCGVATRYFTERITGIPTEALEALEFSRYAVATAPAGSLVVAVSNSGEVARSVESLKFAREAGLRTVGITYKAESRLAQHSDLVLPYDYRDVGFGPGTMSYLASVLSLHIVSLRIAELNRRVDEQGIDVALGHLTALAPVLRATIDACDEPAKALASTLDDSAAVFVVGGGPNYGTALFAMAKMIECARHNTVAQQLEEWAHEQYFCCENGTVTLVLAPPGAAVDRAREQLRAVRDMRGTAVVVCAADDEETKALADVVLPVPGSIAEDLSPLVYLAPVEQFAMHFAMAHDKVMLGFDDDFRKQVNFRQIFDSTIPEHGPGVNGALRPQLDGHGA